MAAQEDGSFWARWRRWPYRVAAVALVLAGYVVGGVPLTGAADLAASLLAPLLTAAGAVLLLGSVLRGGFQATDDEVRRDPPGRNPLSADEQLSRVTKPRTRWLVLAGTAFILATLACWLAYQAARRDDSAYIGVAIIPALAATVLTYGAWRTRQLLERR